jgi:restriction system protein
VYALQQRNQEQTQYSDSISSAEFEGHCALALNRNGWQAPVVGKSGDQGADVIAEREDLRVVIQCKKYSAPVGNAAVQEVFAAKAFQQATHAAVVSNAAFTKAAHELAATTGVMLLHVSELDRLWTIVGEPRTRAR